MIATYHSGFAPRDGMPRYPSLWRGCVGAWCPGLGPSGGVLRDWSGRQNHGTLTNMDLSAAWQPGALAFDGSNDYIDLGDSDAARTLERSAWSISLWLKPLNDARAFLCASHHTAADKYMIAYHNVNKIQIGSAGSSPIGLSLWTTSAVVISNAWQHIVMSMTTSGWAVWHNGSSQSITAISGLNVNASFAANDFTKLILSGYILNNSHNLPTNSYIDDIRLYNRAISQTEISLLARRRRIAYELAPRHYATTVAGGNRRRRYLIGCS